MKPGVCGDKEEAVGAQAITRAGLHARDKAMMDFVIGSPWQGQAREFAIAALIEDADEDPLGVARDHRHIDAVVIDGHAQRRGPPGRYRKALRHDSRSGYDRGFAATGAGLDFGERARQTDQWRQRRLRLEPVFGGIGFVALDVDTQGGAGGAGAGESIDDTGAIREQDAQALSACARTVDGIQIGEVVGAADGGTAEARADEAPKFAAELPDEGMGGALIDFLIVVPRVVVAAIGPPVLPHDVGDALATPREDIQPQQDGPQPILLAHVVGSSAGALLAANR